MICKLIKNELIFFLNSLIIQDVNPRWHECAIKQQTRTYKHTHLMPCVTPHLTKRRRTRASHVPCNPDAAPSWCNSSISQLYTLMKGLSGGIWHTQTHIQAVFWHEAAEGESRKSERRAER